MDGRTIAGAERATGCIVGLAVGDALGYPHEFRRVAQVQAELGPDGITDFVALQDPRFSRPFIIGKLHPPGTFTDDTQMSLALAEALIEAPTGDVERLMPVIARHFVAWYFSADNNRSPGQATGTGCQALRSGTPWREAGVADSKGCGANMRVAPIGLFYEDLDLVAQVARAQAVLTHRHDAAIAGAAAAALLVALALRDTPPAQMHAEVMRRCGGRSADFDAVFGRVPAVIDADPARVLVARGATPVALGEGWVAEEAVAAAFYCFWRFPDDYRAAVLLAANTDGDSDSLACIAGGISGARLGIASIPDRWVTGVEDAQRLQDIAVRLWARRLGGNPPGQRQAPADDPQGRDDRCAGQNRL